MPQKDQKPATDIFNGVVFEWTPRQAVGSIFVLYQPMRSGPEDANRYASVLSEAELARADRFLTEAERENYVQRRVFRRRCGTLALGINLPLSQIVFEESKKGRPYLTDSPDIWFSFSSCRFGFLGAWSSTNAVGVDIEDRTSDQDVCELAVLYFTEAEARAVLDAEGSERLRKFFRLWCLKEAALKSIGEGLPTGLSAFEFKLVPSLRVVDAPREYCEPEDLDARLFEVNGICAALVARTVSERITADVPARYRKE